MAISRATKLYGYPGLIYLMKIDLWRGEKRYIDRLRVVKSWYSALRGYLPVKMEKDLIFYNDHFAPMLLKVEDQIRSAHNLYKPGFEGESYDPDEQDFDLYLFAIEVNLDEITANARILDKESLEDGLDAA